MATPHANTSTGATGYPLRVAASDWDLGLRASGADIVIVIFLGFEDRSFGTVHDPST